jgi:hypothetical protein
MSDRLALLSLTGAGERECGDCAYLERSHCEAFFVTLPLSAVPWRLPACLSAEREAARLRAVEVAARAFMEGHDGPDCYNDSTYRALAALRAALKES